MESEDFRAEVAAEVNSKYYGYLISTTRESGRYRFEGPARAFTAKYGDPVTIAWPDATDFLYRDSRANAASLVQLEPDTDFPESDNLRIYHYPLRVGFDGNRYQYQDTLLVVHLDPFTGTRSAFTVRETSGQIGIYPLEAKGVPSHFTEASLVTVLGIATTEEMEVPVGPRFLRVKVRVKVPRHTYAAASYRYPPDQDRRESTLLGVSLGLSPADQEVLRGVFEQARRARRDGTALAASRFRQAFTLVTTAVDRTPPTIARQPKRSGLRAR